MRKNIFISLLTILLLMIPLSQVNGTAIDSLVASGNQMYAKKEYEKAIVFYRQVIDSGYTSADLYYNLGCAYYKSHKLPEAILAFERAKLRDPANEDVKYNLELASRQITDKIEELPVFFIKRWLRSFLSLFSSDRWAYISMIAFVFALGAFLLYLFMTRLYVRKISFWSGIIFIIISVAAFVFSFRQKKNVMDNPHAIIMSPAVTVKSSPDESGTGLFVIHEGLKVSVEDSISDWREIRLANGNKGWIKVSEMEKI